MTLVLRCQLLRPDVQLSTHLRTLRVGVRFSSQRASDSLRILFCGSDAFSIESLKRLKRAQELNPAFIASLDVVCRPGKPTGRGSKDFREVPIKAAAQKLALPLHQIDTFTGWQPPTPQGELINLIIAVSFGLRVPRRLLNGAKYGGLNVHPSQLPDLRGPAPLHHTLLQGRKHVGITLQTLHPEHFDHGVILRQTPDPGLEILQGGSCTVAELENYVAPHAADMLLAGLQDRVFLEPLQHATQYPKDLAGMLKFPQSLQHASKITKEHSHIDWNHWTADRILRASRVLGPLWNMFEYQDRRSIEMQSKRILFHGFSEMRQVERSPRLNSQPAGTMTLLGGQTGGQLGIWTCDQKLLLVSAATLDGSKLKTGAAALPLSDAGPLLAGVAARLK